MRVPPFLALVVCSLSLQGQTSPSATPGNNGGGAASKVYKNDALHLSYTYPAAYSDASAMVGPAFQASLSQASAEDQNALRCVTLPFSAMDASKGLSLVLLVRADAGCLKKTFTAADLPEFTRGEVQGLAASGAHTQFSDPVPFTTAKHDAEMLRGTFELPTGQQLHAMVVCVLMKPDVACWQFLASSEDSVRFMSAFPVSLEGGAVLSLVPPAAAAAKP